MNEKKKIILNETFASAVQNHKKGNFQVAEKLYKEILETKIWEINGLNQLDYNELSRSVSNENNYPLYYYLIDLMEQKWS